jgi:hypothetical protein
MQLQYKQAARPFHVHTTCNPYAKLLYVKCARNNTNLWNKKSGIGHQLFIYTVSMCMFVQMQQF